MATANNGTELDRESAYERLAERTLGVELEPNAASPPPAAREPTSRPRASRREDEASAMEKFFDNAAVKQFMRSAAAGIARSIFGTGRRRRR